jgi:hypothetical protein
MTPREQLINELQQATESSLRAELSLHGLEPSEKIRKEILINMLCAVYFEG